MKQKQIVDSATLTQKQILKCLKIVHEEYFLSYKTTKKDLLDKLVKVVGKRSIAKDIVRATLS